MEDNRDLGQEDRKTGGLGGQEVRGTGGLGGQEDYKDTRTRGGRQFTISHEKIPGGRGQVIITILCTQFVCRESLLTPNIKNYYFLIFIFPLYSCLGPYSKNPLGTL